MDKFFLTTASFFILLIIAGVIAYLSKRKKIPSAVTLVGVGIIIAFFSKLTGFEFLNSFELTPEILFYIFLPILLFESAYHINYKELLRNIYSVSLLSTVSLILSALIIALLFKFGLYLIGIEISFLVSLVFGSLISATDTAAVLAIFKDLGVPRRLQLIFEGESLFNDGTAIAFFRVVLAGLGTFAVSSFGHTYFDNSIELLRNYFGGFFPFFKGGLSLISMVLFGLLVGIFMGVIFSKGIQKVRNDKFLEITLTVALAHITFLFAEWLNHFLLPVSGIIATVSAAIVLGNYGKYKITPQVESVMVKYWEFFAFITNCLVFILVGIMLVNLDIPWKQTLIPMILSIPIVLIGRALSVYPIFGLINYFKAEEKIPKSWQHIISFGALRGSLSIMMILLIPSNLYIDIWNVGNMSLRNFLLAISLGPIIFSTFFQSISLSFLIKKLGVNKLHDISIFEYIKGRTFLANNALEKIKKLRHEKNIDVEEQVILSKKYENILKESMKDFENLRAKLGEDFPIFIKKVITLHALQVEKYWLKKLYASKNINEQVFKNLMKKITSQIRRVEKGESQLEKIKQTVPKKDFFEIIGEYFIDFLEPRLDDLSEKYMKIRTKHIITEKALESLNNLGKISLISNCPSFHEVKDLYEDFYKQSELERRALYKSNKHKLINLSSKLTREWLVGMDKKLVLRMIEQEIISPRLEKVFK